MEMQYIGHILYLSSYPNCLIVLPTMKIKQQYTHRYLLSNNGR